MRAGVVPEHGPAEVIEIRSDWPEPDPPGPGEVLVAVEAAGLNPSDTKIRAAGGSARAAGVTLPYVAGREAAGRVLEVGEGVSGLGPGDAVFAFFGWGARPGGHAEQLVVDAAALARRPDGVELTESAGLPLAGLTSLQALEALDPPPGARILVTSGSGGVGHLAVQVAVARGLEVVATTGASNANFVRGLGAAEVIDYRHPDAALAARGIGFLLDSVGGGNIDLFQDHLAAGARVAAVAGVPAETRNGVTVTPVRCRADGQQLSYLAGLMAEEKLTVTVQEVFPLERLADAHRLLEGRHVRGKLVITV